MKKELTLVDKLDAAETVIDAYVGLGSPDVLEVVEFDNSPPEDGPDW